jgi:uncharacterized membrane protein YfcA
MAPTNREKVMFGVVATKTETADLKRSDQAFLEGVAGRAGARRFVFPLPLAPVAGVAGAALLLAVGIMLLAGAIPLPGIGALSLYLPVADRSTNVILLVGIGFVVGVLSGMTGVGGGFLMTPLLMSIGIPSAVAVGTDSAQIAGTASSGALSHARLGNVDLKLGFVILIGSLVGGTLGVRLVYFLREMGSFDFWVRMIYIVVLGGVGILMLRESVRTWLRSGRLRTIRALVDEGYEDLRAKLVTPEEPKTGSPGGSTDHWPLQMDFRTSRIRTSLIFPLALGLIIGVLTALMGVGGGFVMVPAMIYILGVPTHVAVGTSLFQIVFTSANVGVQQAMTNHNVDILLAVLLLTGAAVGAQIGARLSTLLEGHQLRTFLGVVVIIVTIKMLFEIMMAPSSLFSLSSGGH